MTTSVMSSQENMIYQVEPNTAHTMQKIKESIWHCCSKYMHRRVRVKLVNGMEYEGMIVGADHNYVYLVIDNPNMRNPYPFGGFGGFGGYGGYGYHPYYNQTILPLVLFELLVISLL